ncbi:alpha/beta hydrolase [Polaromonas sp. SM01]|uniref:alpha/beta hydrolase n=1 Tax=Polaromonas sp. SM01 TaxID=3085630 RepID=UPI0029814619|nr:alpha/beta hydrolase [Polaromonas sp. SM01]MDW5441254.1 alpha/beta hydrolase [Polaromonas sp. SM01]
MTPDRRTWLRYSLSIGLLCLALAGQGALAQTTQKVVDIPSRPGVTQRFVYISPPAPKAAVILLAGGHGGLQISANGAYTWGAGNFLVRTRQQFADAGLAVVVIDAPSDRQSSPYLSGFRQTPEHAADVLAVIAWLKQQAPVPVWLVGTSRGTQSAGAIATVASPAQGGPDGLVLTATILTDDTGRAVPKMPLEKLAIPVLVVHNTQDGCKHCAFSDMPLLMTPLAKTPKAELITLSGGQSQGDPCEAKAYHGFNGLEAEAVGKISHWVLTH